MALADLLRAIEADAEAEVAAAKLQATAEAAAIVERARQQADVIAARSAAEAEAAGRADVEREIALARLAGAATVRAAREQAFQSLLAGVRARLDALRESHDYPAYFRALVAESRAALPTARELRVDPRDADLAAAAAAGLRVIAALDTAGGVELAGEDGRTVRNTLEQRFDNADLLLRTWFGRTLVSELEAASTR